VWKDPLGSWGVGENKVSSWGRLLFSVKVDLHSKISFTILVAHNLTRNYLSS
jgi:hypothetical protein